MNKEYNEFEISFNDMRLITQE